MESEQKLKISVSGDFMEKLRRTQRRLSRKLVIENDLIHPEEVRYVAGVDVSYKGKFSFGAVSVLKLPELEEVEVKTVVNEALFPYIPTFLGFREVPAVLPAIKNLKIKPEVFLVDGHGYAHPERFGFASHLGLILKTPTIGVAKSILTGKLESSSDVGYVWIKDKGEIVGVALQLDKAKKPIFVSVGSYITLPSAIRIVKRSIKFGNTPEPIRYAHLAANEEKNRLGERIN
ncbi:MAG: endonuclease V [Candidatus Bathyarchaeia archaeon]